MGFGLKCCGYRVILDVKSSSITLFFSISLVAGDCGSGSRCSVHRTPHYRGEGRLILLL